MLVTMLFVAAAAMPRSAGGHDAASRLVQTAIHRMGGLDALRRLETLRLEWVGYVNLLEQSERPESRRRPPSCSSSRSRRSTTRSRNTGSSTEPGAWRRISSR